MSSTPDLTSTPTAFQRLGARKLLLEAQEEKRSEAFLMLADLLLEAAAVARPPSLDRDEEEDNVNLVALFLPKRAGEQQPRMVVDYAREVLSVFTDRTRLRPQPTVSADPLGAITVKTSDATEKEEKYVVLSPSAPGHARLRVVRHGQPPHQWLYPHHWCHLRTQVQSDAAVFQEWKLQMSNFFDTQGARVAEHNLSKVMRLQQQCRWWLECHAGHSNPVEIAFEDHRAYLYNVEMLLEILILSLPRGAPQGRTKILSHGTATAKFWRNVDLAWSGSIEMDYAKFLAEVRSGGC